MLRGSEVAPSSPFLLKTMSTLTIPSLPPLDEYSLVGIWMSTVLYGACSTDYLQTKNEITDQYNRNEVREHHAPIKLKSDI